MRDASDLESPVFNTKIIIDKYSIDEKLENYFQEILDYNRKVNIVSRETTLNELLIIATDSLIPFEFVPPPKEQIFDIGPGGGFPSIVILLAFPHLKALLIERTKKKAVFLNKITDLFKLNARVIDSNFLDIAPTLKPASFETGFMKLVRPEKKLLRAAIKLLKPGGNFVYYSEYNKSESDLSDKISIKKHKYILDKSNRPRTITIFTK